MRRTGYTAGLPALRPPFIFVNLLRPWLPPRPKLSS
nr:MAG TPA: hypothetical protein [Caudoviricetes sp.]